MGIKKKLGRPQKKKIIDSFVDRKPSEVEKQDELILCECGNEVVSSSHQCWACSHRA